MLLHASHAALIKLLVSPYFNENAETSMAATSTTVCVLPLEALAVTRDASGGKMATGMRFNCDEDHQWWL